MCNYNSELRDSYTQVVKSIKNFTLLILQMSLNLNATLEKGILYIIHKICYVTNLSFITLYNVYYLQIMPNNSDHLTYSISLKANHRSVYT